MLTTVTYYRRFFVTLIAFLSLWACAQDATGPVLNSPVVKSVAKPGDSMELLAARSHHPAYAEKRADVDVNKVAEMTDAYLRANPDAPNRALLLAQTGSLYGSYADAERGILPDYAKARTYLEAAIVEAPALVLLDLVLARTQLASIHEDKAERLRADMTVAKWLRNIQRADIEGSIREQFSWYEGEMPYEGVDDPDAQWTEESRREAEERAREAAHAERERRIDKEAALLEKRIAGVIETQEKAIVEEAAAMAEPDAALRKVGKELPGTSAAKLAAEIRTRIAKGESARAAADAVFLGASQERTVREN